MIELLGKRNKDCKIFTDNIESEALQMIQGILDQRVSEGVPVRIMPDVHAGKGIVIGFTMPMTKLLSPNFIGVDIGCGVLSAKIGNCNLELSEIDDKIRQVVPMGFSINEKVQVKKLDLAYLNQKVTTFITKFNEKFSTNYTAPKYDERWVSSKLKEIGIGEGKFYKAIGSLGGGNHFLEVGEDENKDKWLTIHCGSRNFGLKVAKHHTNIAKNQTKNPSREYLDKLNDITANTYPKSGIPKAIDDLKAQFGLGDKTEFLSGQLLVDYLVDMLFAQYYAELNRKTILNNIKDVLGIKIINTVESVHNYVDFDDFIIRKGAIPSYSGSLSVIPFNMKDGLFICEGKSNEDWNCSAPHGAGRIMSRSKAKQAIELEDFMDCMKDVYSTSVCTSTLDEAPMAYKDFNEIAGLIGDTVNIIHKVKPILNIKSN